MDDALPRIMENLLRETTPRSISLRVTVEQERGKVNERATDLTLEQTYLQTGEGQRFFDERMASSTGYGTRRTAYCDGSKCANIRYDRDDLDAQAGANICNEFMNDTGTGFWSAPDPVRFRYVGLTPLPEALPTANRAGKARLIERDCDVFHFEDVGIPGMEQSLVFALDEETSVPLKVTAYSDPDHVRDGLPNWVWEADTLNEVDGYHFPLSSRYTTFAIVESGGGRRVAKPDIVRAIRVEEIAYDEPIAESAFWPTFQPGILVADLIAGRSYRVPGESLSTEERTPGGIPIRVAEPGQGVWWSATGATLSLAALIVACWLWRRSR